MENGDSTSNKESVKRKWLLACLIVIFLFFYFFMNVFKRHIVRIE